MPYDGYVVLYVSGALGKDGWKKDVGSGRLTQVKSKDGESSLMFLIAVTPCIV